MKKMLLNLLFVAAGLASLSAQAATAASFPKNYGIPPQREFDMPWQEYNDPYGYNFYGHQDFAVIKTPERAIVATLYRSPYVSNILINTNHDEENISLITYNLGSYIIQAPAVITQQQIAQLLEKLQLKVALPDDLTQNN
ncbi:hypothetical protein [Psittacicella hinzii]|uniref:Uncharacterized protein n=1 Tax=Psittacicella hinzii TaxID=2028575 RepID=A0A3A1YSW3_9GAMM|nr:hypothetical protein [Psittacicella hinzii]RIY40010.1 hypothetical protein CKF58_01205 [Psittacicella hinzii]